MGNVKHTFVAQSIDGGVAYNGPLGSTLPTDHTTALNAALEDVGTLAVDGLSVGISRQSSSVKDFDGADYIDIQTDYSGTFKIKILDIDNAAAKKAAFGEANVTVTPGVGGAGDIYHVEHNSDQLPLRAWVFQAKSGDKRKRWVIQYGRVTEMSEVKIESQDAAGYELTIKASRNDDGNFVEEYGDIDGGASSGS